VEGGPLGVIRHLFLMVWCGSRYCCGTGSFWSTNVGGSISRLRETNMGCLYRNGELWYIPKIKACNVCIRYLHVVVVSWVGVLQLFVTLSAYTGVGLYLS